MSPALQRQRSFVLRAFSAVAPSASSWRLIPATVGRVTWLVTQTKSANKASVSHVEAAAKSRPFVAAFVSRLHETPSIVVLVAMVVVQAKAAKMAAVIVCRPLSPVVVAVSTPKPMASIVGPVEMNAPLAKSVLMVGA